LPPGGIGPAALPLSGKPGNRSFGLGAPRESGIPSGTYQKPRHRGDVAEGYDENPSHQDRHRSHDQVRPVPAHAMGSIRPHTTSPAVDVYVLCRASSGIGCLLRKSRWCMRWLIAPQQAALQSGLTTRDGQRMRTRKSAMPRGMWHRVCSNPIKGREGGRLKGREGGRLSRIGKC
jgi:hypothetical protein